MQARGRFIFCTTNLIFAFAALAAEPELSETAKRENAKKKHWAFQAVKIPIVPITRLGNPGDNTVRNEIDTFILARLEKENLTPSPEADRHTLIRRLSLDLVGLPPSIEEIDAFVADKDANAYEKVVERLLASPHYGERWGRHWLDAARYADSDGFEKDKSRAIWFYRDYVINALNKDTPYDQFIIEQLAGDLLPNATQDQIVATGYLRNSMLNEEGGIDPEQFRMEGMFDRMDAIGKGILGLTIQCAQCHSHKYDPLTQEEYYRLFAFINNDHEAQRIVYTPEEQMKIANLTRRMREIEADIQHRSPGWQERMATWERREMRDEGQARRLTFLGSPLASLPRPSPWVMLPIENAGDNSQRYIPQKDGSLLALGYAPTKHDAHFRAKTDLKGITGFRLEYLNDANLPCGGPGRSFKGTCALTEFAVTAAAADKPAKKTRIKIAGASADFEQAETPLETNFDDKSKNRRLTGPVKFAIDGNANTAWGIDAGPGRRNQERKAVFLCAEKVGFENGTILTFELKQMHGGWNSDDHMNNNLGRFRISATTHAAVKADPLPKRVRDILAIPAEKRRPGQVAAVFSYWRTTVPEWKHANAQIEALWKEWPEGSTSLTLIARDDARATQMLKRGDWLKPEKSVTAGAPAFLHSLPDGAAPTRLTFARWLVDRRSPTTARVMVNRVWQAYFGTGLVTTPEDFGLQSDPPSHPELLDWLAAEFMTRWSLKHLHRLIVNSATYRQSSRVPSPQPSPPGGEGEGEGRDPNNRLLARGPRFRVEGEIVRDIALTASGLLNPKVGGRSIMPPAPAFLFLPPSSYAPFPWVDETGPDKYRRGIYVFRRRSTPLPMLQTFDVPNADFACVRRQRSNSPLQALTSLNEPLFVEAAQALARKTLMEGGKTDTERVVYAFRRTLTRPPSEEEKRELLTLLAKQRQRIADGWLNPSEIATGNMEVAHDLPPGTTPAQLASYTIMSRVLLNLDETITKE